MKHEHIFGKDFKQYHPVIKLPQEFEVYDFSKGYDPNRKLLCDFGVGKYNEKRPSMYTTTQFTESRRDIHIGIDIAAPVGTPIHSFFDGEIHCLGDNKQHLDYGPTIISSHYINGYKIYALHGHLSRKSLGSLKAGQTIHYGQILGWVGDKTENGGWNPHLHFQLSLNAPISHDMPGVVNERDLQSALETYPDPRHVLGPLY